MAAILNGRRDIQGRTNRPRLRLLAPIRYLAIRHPEKSKYDFQLPAFIALIGWSIYNFAFPSIAIFGDLGLLKFVRDLLVMAVPFMIGSLATVAMGAPGQSLDRRPDGVDLLLHGHSLTLRQFVCYLLGYLTFLGLVTLAFAVASELFRPVLQGAFNEMPNIVISFRVIWSLALAILLSSLTITTFWALYFLTEVVNIPR